LFFSAENLPLKKVTYHEGYIGFELKAKAGVPRPRPWTLRPRLLGFKAKAKARV